MKLTRIFLPGLFALIFVGCAVNLPYYSRVADQIPPLSAGQGRVFFYWPDPLGHYNGLETRTYLNGKFVGILHPQCFLYADAPAGSCETVFTTQILPLTFPKPKPDAVLQLAGGETKYIRINVTKMDWPSAVIQPMPEDKDTAMKTLPQCIFNEEPFHKRFK